MSERSDFLDKNPRKNSLASGNWKEADKQTYRVILNAIGWAEGAIIRDDDGEKLTCADLPTLERLWVKYSRGRFGFSLQKSIFASINGTSNYDETVWLKFGRRVGWHLDGKWLVDDRLHFSLAAPAQF